MSSCRLQHDHEPHAIVNRGSCSEAMPCSAAAMHPVYKCLGVQACQTIQLGQLSCDCWSYDQALQARQGGLRDKR